MTPTEFEVIYAQVKRAAIEMGHSGDTRVMQAGSCILSVLGSLMMNEGDDGLDAIHAVCHEVSVRNHKKLTAMFVLGNGN